ncbi:MAG: ABC transporter ATP-binding protein [Planctomycetota bacterium]|nr:ABC transporter ATP-binding protein [Planctomycetota bacterium]
MREDRIAIRTRELTRYFGHNAALRSLTLDVPRGQVTALIGHNGAGKTTLIRLLLGLLPPTRGRAELLGCDSRSLTPEVRARVGYLAEGHFLWGWMKARDAARLQRETFPRWDQHLFDSMLKFFGVASNARVGQISRGQRAGVSLAMTLATDPELLVLDDPSMGLDPVARRALVEGLLAFARRDDRTILVCTHLLDDVERLADRIAIVSHGRLLVDSGLSEFRERVCGWTLDAEFGAQQAAQIPGLIDSRQTRERTHLVVADPDLETEAAIQRISGTARREELTLEDAVLAYLRPAAMVGSISDALEDAR